MRVIPEISAELENFRMVQLQLNDPFAVIRRDSIEPVPIGTLIAKVFRVTGYDKDCDGSLMARLEEVDERGESTGYEVDQVGICGDIALDAPNELHILAMAKP